MISSIYFLYLFTSVCFPLFCAVGRSQLCVACHCLLLDPGVPVLLEPSRERLQWFWLVGADSQNIWVTHNQNIWVTLTHNQNICVKHTTKTSGSHSHTQPNHLGTLTHNQNLWLSVCVCVCVCVGLTLWTWASGCRGLWCCWSSPQASSPTSLCSWYVGKRCHLTPTLLFHLFKATCYKVLVIFKFYYFYFYTISFNLLGTILLIVQSFLVLMFIRIQFRKPFTVLTWYHYLFRRILQEQMGNKQAFHYTDIWQ